MQTWNNVLDYIKMNLGAPIQSIELSDDDIVKYIKEHTLPLISNYVPYTKYIVLNTDDFVDESIGKYKLNTSDYIIDVLNLYSSINTGSMNVNMNKIIESLIANEIESIKQYLSTTLDFRFEQPNYIILYDSYSTSYFPVLVEYNTVHQTLDTIPSDIYVNFFKPLALAEIKMLLGQARRKFQNVSTPFGPINTDGDNLYQIGLQEREQLLQRLRDGIPPDKFIEFI